MSRYTRQMLAYFVVLFAAAVVGLRLTEPNSFLAEVAVLLTMSAFAFGVCFLSSWRIDRREAARRAAPINPEYRKALSVWLNALKGGGVLLPGEVDDAAFMRLAVIHGEDDDLDAVAGLLAFYQAEHGTFANLMIEQPIFAVTRNGAIRMIEAFADLAGRRSGLGEIAVSIEKEPDARNAFDGELRFTLDGAAHRVALRRGMDFSAASLGGTLSRIFDVPPPHFASADVGNCFLISRLTVDQVAELNAAFDPEEGQFVRL